MHWNNVFLGCLLKTRLDFAIGATRSVQFRVWGDAQVSTDQKVGPFVWWGLRAGTTQCSVLSSTVCRHRCAPGRHGPELGAPHQKPHGQFFPLASLQHKPMTWDPQALPLGALKRFTASLADEGPSCQSLLWREALGEGSMLQLSPEPGEGKPSCPARSRFSCWGFESLKLSACSFSSTTSTTLLILKWL